jgi:hypothetical protein
MNLGPSLALCEADTVADMARGLFEWSENHANKAVDGHTTAQIE